MDDDTPDTQEPTPTDTTSGQTETPLRGTWRDKRATAAAFGISEKTVERRAKDGRIQQRDLPGNRVQFWVPADLLSGQSEDMDSSELDEQDESDRRLAISSQAGLAAIEMLGQLLRESQQRIEELSGRVAQLEAEKEQLKAEQPRLTESTDTRQPWWRRWFAP